MQFWFVAGVLAGACAMLVLFPLARGALGTLQHRNVRIAIGIVGVAAFGGAALALYYTFGSPQMVTGHAAPTASSPHPGVTPSSAGESANSMEDVVAALEARIAREGGKREDWLLLAQSYDFLGRAADAQSARAKADAGGTPPSQSAPAPSSAASAPAVNAQPVVAAASESAAQYEQRVRAKPADADAWRSLTALYRRQHDYAKARDAFTHLIKLKAMDADTWADYADVLASASGGSLRGESAKAIDAALRLEPAHPKALWLKASLAHEEHRYGDALVVWKQLRNALPPDSSDLRIVDANIAEAASLAGMPAPAAPTPATAAPAAAAEVSGTVSVDSRLAARVPAGATLFIYAKAVDSPGPPLAVLRQVANGWPVSFRLDDTLAMIPSRRLSQFDRVIVEARISRTGQATPAAGDLYVTSAVLKPTERKKLALVIDHEVG